MVISKPKIVGEDYAYVTACAMVIPLTSTLLEAC